MIFDKMKNAACYAGLSDNFRKAIEFMLSRDFSLEPAGKYEIDGREVYATLSDQTNMPAEKEKYECHRNYADIQLVLTGGERMFYTEMGNCENFTEYNDVKDIFFCTAEKGVDLCFYPGDFAVFFPQDAHMPGVCLPENVGKEGLVTKKLVIKVRV